MKLLWNGAGGFIRCELNEHTRFNVYSPDLPPTVQDGRGTIHDHRYTMSSRVLIGKLEHIIYSVTPDENGNYISYHVIDDTFHPIEPVTVEVADRVLIEAGQDFHFGGPDWWHRVIPHGPTLTCVTRIADVSDGEPCKIVSYRDYPPQNAFDPETAPSINTMVLYTRGFFDGYLQKV